MTGIAFASAFAVAAATSAAADLAPLVKLVGTGDDVAEPVDSIRFEMLPTGFVLRRRSSALLCRISTNQTGE